jgi:CRP-like cAMP-binding protein
MESIFETLLTSEEIPEELKERMGEHVRIQHVKKGDLLQSPGALNPGGFFVRKGLLRCYVLDEKGKEHIYMFAPAGWAIGDVEAQAFEKPSSFYVDALEDSEIIVAIEGMHNNYFESLSNEAFPGEMMRLMRRVGVLQRRVIMLMRATAKERYDAFLKTYPDIVQRVPQKMIASYLGITPEALSKIRKEMVSK